MDVILIYIAVGVFAGILAGLFGVGGGLVIVPVLVYVFTQQGFVQDSLVHMAVGTSLATIVFTSLSSIYAHHKRGAVRWQLVWLLTPGIIIGAFVGAAIADWMSATLLRRFFAVFEWLVGLQLLINVHASAKRSLPGRRSLFVAGNVIGCVSAIVGIGGGTLTVPFLVWCEVKIREAVATSSACGLPIAVAGAVGFVLTGWNMPAQPPWSLGYVYLPALLAIVTASVLAAPFGAWMAHRLPGQVLKRIFGLFLLALGSYMFIHE